MKAKIVGKVVRQLLKRLILSGSVVVVCILVMQVNLTLGVVLMMLYSSWMMVQSSRKEMPLGKFTAILPGLMSLTCFLIMMLVFLDVQNPLMPLVGLGLGLLPGWLMARGHQIYKKNDRLYAKRTFLYVLIWTISLLFTQGSTLLGLREITDFGLLLNGFSTAMMVVLSIVLLSKSTTKLGLDALSTHGLLAILPLVFILFSVMPSNCNAQIMYSIQGKGPYSMDQVFDYVFRDEYLPLLSRNAKRNVVHHYDSDHVENFSIRLQSNNRQALVSLSIKYFDSNEYLNERLQSMLKSYDIKSRDLKSSDAYIAESGTLGSGGTGFKYSFIVSSHQGTRERPKKYISAGARAVWQYRQWLFTIVIDDYPYLPDSLLGLSYIQYFNNVISVIQSRIRNVGLFDNSTPPSNPQSPESPGFADVVAELSGDEYLESVSFENWNTNEETGGGQPESTPQANPEPIEYWDEPEQQEHSGEPEPIEYWDDPELAENSGQPEPIEYWDEPELQEQDAEPEYVEPDSTSKLNPYPKSTPFVLEFTDAEIASGAAVAVLMLLASLGLNTSITAAQETANAVMAASQETGPTFRDKQGDSFDRNEKGEYLAPDDNGDWVWMGEDDARESSRALQAEVGRHQRESDKTWEDIQRDANERMDQKGRDGLESQRKMAEKLAATEAAQLIEKHKNEALLDKLKKTAKEGYDQSEEMIDRLKNEEKWDEIKQIYRDRLEKIVRDNEAKRDSESSYADKLWVGEKISQAVLAGSKGAMLVVGGPAGAVYTGLGMGAISAAEEGAEVQAKGGSLGKVMAHAAAGFLVGVKDGAVSVYVNLPGTTKLTKILLPAGTDAAEMYIRTGDTKQALQAAGYSVAADLVGLKTGEIKGKVSREIAEAGTTVFFAGTRSYQNGGSFMDGVGNGLLNHVGSKAGGAMAGKAIDSGLFSGVDPERGVKHALDEVSEAGKKTIELENQSEIVKELNGTRRAATEAEGPYRTDADGELLNDKNGHPIFVKKEYVDPVRALDQLQDTQSSRTAKQAEDGIKNAIIDTRQDKIYKPANDATLNAVKNSADPDTRNWLNDNLQTGDELKMDPFSTPGKPPSLGADRDVRMVVSRTDPVTGKTVKIKVPRKHWEDQAYKDFYEHSKNLHAEAGRNLDAEIKQRIENGEGIYASRNRGLKHLQQPEFSDKQLDTMRDNLRSRFERQDEMKGTNRTSTQIDSEVEKSIQRLQEQGLTAEQIKHRTFAEAHNQLFTDQYHMEASRGNADQGFKIIKGQGIEPTQVRSNVLDAKDGKAPLSDPEGFGRMWAEKSHFYHDNPAEAMAQSKKGIYEMLGIREGQRAQGLDPAPLKPETAEAMTIIAKAPTGIDATPEAIDRANRDIQAIRDSEGRQVYSSSADAMEKIGRSVEFNKWTQSAELNVKAVNRPGGLTGSEASRIARLNQEREWARELEGQDHE